MKSKPILIKPDQAGQVLEPIDPSQKTFSEMWLQELIQSNPQILPVDEFEPIYWPLVAIGREIPTKSGPIDNLFISVSGYPVLVETKLWRNSEAKREVIAQVLDYAGELSKWTYSDLEAITIKRTKKGVLELIQESLYSDPEKIPTEDQITKNLRLGRILILIVSDHIRESLITMLDYINKYSHLATNVGLVELQCYRLPEKGEEIFVVPSIVAKTEIVERSIVQVTLLPEQPYLISVSMKKDDKKDLKYRSTLTEDAFWEGVNNQAPKSVNAMQLIFNHFEKNPYVNIQMRQSAIVIRVQCPESDQSVSALILYLSGNIECWPDTLLTQLQKGNIDQNLGESYLLELRKILSNRSKNGRIFLQSEKINLEKLFETTDSFIHNVSTSIPLIEE